MSRFTSKADGMSRAKKYHACLDCRKSQREIWKVCPECGSKNRQKFDSQAELQRGMGLLLMQDYGKISEIKFQPRFDLIFMGKKIGVYTADVQYVEAGQTVVEDTKPRDFIDKYAQLKMTIFEIQYGTQIRIPQRKSGNMN